MKKMVFPLLLLLFLAGTLIACTHIVPKQHSTVTASNSSTTSAIASRSSAAVSSGKSGAAASNSSQNQELQKILDNVNSIGNSADSLDNAGSSDLAIPEN